MISVLCIPLCPQGRCLQSQTLEWRIEAHGAMQTAQAFRSTGTSMDKWSNFSKFQFSCPENGNSNAYLIGLWQRIRYIESIYSSA